METPQLWLFEPPAAPPPPGPPGLEPDDSRGIELAPACGDVLSRIRARRRQACRAAARLHQAVDRQLALLFERALKERYPDKGRNDLLWEGAEGAMHLLVLEQSVEDIMDPTCKFGSEKHTELWTWIYGTDELGLVPFSFVSCCRVAKLDPDSMRAYLLRFLVRGRHTTQRRTPIRELAQARGFTWDAWRRMQWLYRELCTAVDLARGAEAA